MADQPGFLGSLGLNNVDERDLVQAQRDALATQRQQRLMALGAQTGRGAAGLIGGVIGASRGQGFGPSAQRAHQTATDIDTAHEMGLTVEQIRGRRKIRQLAADDNGNPSFTGRKALLKKILSIANQSGDTELVGNTLRQLQAVNEQETEFNKLKAQTTKATNEAEKSDDVNAFYNGKSVTGVLAQDDRGRQGLTFDINGKQTFVPWGTNLYQQESALDIAQSRKADPRTDAELISSALGKKEFNSVTNAIDAEKDLLNKYDGVLDLVSQAINDGRAGEIVGQAGKVTAWIDNKVETIRNLLNTFVPGDTFKEDSDLLRKWRGHSNRPNSEVWDQITLPDWARDNSKNAQNYRSRVIEMAYVVARSAEPSNRGLSDNDIERALDRLGVESADPEVMMRRAYDIIIDGTTKIDDVISKHYGGRWKRRDGSVITDEEIDTIFGGQSLKNYRNGVQRLYQKYGIEPGAGNRVIIPGSTVNPNNVNGQPTTAPIPVYTDEDVNNLLDALDE